MLNITVNRTTKHLELTMEGHATGSSEACAAASALAQTLGDYLGEQGYRVELASGRAYLCCPETAENEILFGVFCRGFRRLAITEPDRIRYEENEKV